MQHHSAKREKYSATVTLASPNCLNEKKHKRDQTGNCEKNNKKVGNAVCDKIHNRQQAEQPQSMRLNQAIARAGFCSRRKADEYVFADKVKVNGERVTEPGIKVKPDDAVEVDGQILNASPPLSYIILNKPIHTVCTLHDPQGRRTVIDLLPPDLRQIRLFPVGRLDYFSEGLLLLTNDGELSQRLTHPRHHQAKLYEVLVRGAVQHTALTQMRNGMTIDGNIRLLPIKAETTKLANGNTLIKMELRQGLNRQIRKMCKTFGLVILRLQRTGQGSLRLGKLPPGQTRKLSRKEIHMIRREAGLE